MSQGRVLPIVLLMLGVYAIQNEAVAQKKYSPNHADVKRMVDRALDGLGEINISRLASYQTFAALTIVEAAKRYEGTVPTDHARVVEALSKIKRDIEAGKFDAYNDQQERELYYPSLAIILLCDIGVQKYQEEIKHILEFLVNRQTTSGGFAYKNNIHPGNGVQHDGDTSQTQFVCLALWVARSRGFAIDDQVAARTMEWLLDTNMSRGNWAYLYSNGQPINPPNTMSIHLAALSSVYLLADFLNLSPRIAKSSADVSFDPTFQLPPSVTVYREGENQISNNSVGSKVIVGNSKVKTVKARGNQFLKDNFAPQVSSNSNYYLFAFERYAYFREQSEGSVREIPDWYDQVIESYKSIQTEKGTFPSSGSVETEVVATCFAILFMVRSTEILVPPPGTGNLNGGLGLRENVRLELNGGKVKSFSVVEGLDDVMQLLGSDDIDEQQFELVQQSLAKSVSQLTQDKTKTRRQHLTFMRGLVSDRNYYKRLIAVRLLARQQDMDNVPPLIYALGDPNFEVAREAHNGLRLISRKLDSITLSDDPGYAEFQGVKKQWTEWFLKIRPGAELLD